MIKRVEVTGTSLHKEEDHALRLAAAVDELRRRRSERARAGEQGLTRQGRKGERTETAAGMAEKVTAGGGWGDVVAGHGAVQ